VTETGVPEPVDVGASIHNAFGGVPRPAAAELFVGLRDEQVGELVSEMAAKKWQEVDVRRAPAEVALLRMSPDAFRYFLPAYLLACVEGRDPDGASWVAALACLSPISGGERWRQEIFERRGALFDREQTEAILGFLKHPCVTGELILEDPEAPMVAAWNAAVDFWTVKLADTAN
jgi:hypothetical protein